MIKLFCIVTVRYLPKIFQAFLMSATLSEEVMSLKKLILRNPVSFACMLIFKINERRISKPVC